MSWEVVAERAAKARGAAILARIRAAIAEYEPAVVAQMQGDDLRVRGRGLKQRWLSEPALRFASRIIR